MSTRNEPLSTSELVQPEIDWDALNSQADPSPQERAHEIVRQASEKYDRRPNAPEPQSVQAAPATIPVRARANSVQSLCRTPVHVKQFWEAVDSANNVAANAAIAKICRYANKLARGHGWFLVGEEGPEAWCDVVTDSLLDWRKNPAVSFRTILIRNILDAIPRSIRSRPYTPHATHPKPAEVIYLAAPAFREAQVEGGADDESSEDVANAEVQDIATRDSVSVGDSLAWLSDQLSKRDRKILHLCTVGLDWHEVGRHVRLVTDTARKSLKRAADHALAACKPIATTRPASGVQRAVHRLHPERLAFNTLLMAAHRVLAVETWRKLIVSTERAAWIMERYPAEDQGHPGCLASDLSSPKGCFGVSPMEVEQRKGDKKRRKLSEMSRRRRTRK